MTDWTTLIQNIPGIGPYIPWITLVITIASALAAAMPAPTVTHGIYYYIYQAVNTIAINFGHGKNLSAPESTGIVGGSGAISAPLIATSVVPLAVATPAQKTVTVPPGDPAAVPPAPVVPPPPYVQAPAPPAPEPKP